MIVGYFDESGEHHLDTGQLVNLTLGGCFASTEAWMKFEPEWRAVLDSKGVDWFHMADFEARIPKYDWPETDRRAFLNGLLDAITGHVDEIVGFATTIEEAAAESNRWHRFSDTRGALQKLIFNALDGDYRSVDGRLKLVFARHREVRDAYFSKAMDVIRWDHDGLRSCAVDEPNSNVRLQAADLCAYEIARAQRDRPGT